MSENKQLCLRMRALGVLSQHGSSVATLTTRDGRLTRTGHVGVKEGAREALLFSPAAVRAPSHLPDWVQYSISDVIALKTNCSFFSCVIHSAICPSMLVNRWFPLKYQGKSTEAKT
ncbi:hypothetical protein CapIbe_013566 [Capra ibex]